MQKLGIIQPGRIGDIIYLLPAMHYLKQKTDSHILWPVYKDYLWMFTEVIDFITFIPVENNVYTAVKQSREILQSDYKCDNIIDIAATFPDSQATEEYVLGGDGETIGDGKQESFDMFKYRKLNVPIDEKWKLNNILRRNRIKENELYQQKVKNDKYAVAFLNCSKGRYNVSFDFADGQLIEADEQTNIFHWLKILENATTIITLNSAPLILVEHLNLSAKKIVFRIPTMKMPYLRNQWVMI